MTETRMGLGGKQCAVCVHSTAVQWSPCVQLYCTVQARPHRLRCDQSQSRPVRRQTPASEQTSETGRHWTLDRQLRPLTCSIISSENLSQFEHKASCLFSLAVGFSDLLQVEQELLYTIVTLVQCLPQRLMMKNRKSPKFRGPPGPGLSRDHTQNQKQTKVQ